MRKSSKLFIILIILLLFTNFFTVYYYHNFKNSLIGNIKSYVSMINTVKRNVVVSVPVYDDYITLKKEKKLRTFLLKDHLAVVKKAGLTPILNDEHLARACKENKLVQLQSGSDALYYFYNVRKRYRYLTAATKKGLEILVTRFQENLRKRGDFPTVKIALSSVLRTVEYQKKLQKRNKNATVESTHSYGISFDIFFDDYYVKLPDPYDPDSFSGRMTGMLKSTYGFLMGDSLNGQFKTILAETLIELQDEGILYAILERKQHCFHITIPDQNNQ